ncbi:uncharacterized protein LOC143601551 [Bidens hawaiensis]|uniref:uncharacterized protein LOC143601551 n=1 Tax=Bidens hawaiensis TaxID=980011 RepID=UPI00404A9109
MAEKRSRKTSSSEFTSYSRLAQHFGLSSAEAAVKLGETTGKRVKRGTFRNSCRYVRITEWPWIPKRRTTRASSGHETQVNPTTSGTSSFRAAVATENSYFGTLTATEYMASFSSFIPSRDTTTEASPFENIMTQIEADDTSSLVNPYATEYMGSSTSSFGSPVATEDVGAFLSESLTNQTACGDGDAVSMQDFEEMEYQGNNEDLDLNCFADRLFDFEKWITHNIPY